MSVLITCPRCGSSREADRAAVLRGAVRGPCPTCAEAASLLAELRGRGVSLWDEGGRLRHRAPTGAVSMTMLLDIKARQDAILALLTAEAQEAAEATAVVDGGPA